MTNMYTDLTIARCHELPIAMPMWVLNHVSLLARCIAIGQVR